MDQPLSHLVCNPTAETIAEVIDTDAKRWFNDRLARQLRTLAVEAADDVCVAIATNPAGMIDLGIIFRDGTGLEFTVWFYHVVWMDGFARIKNVLVPAAYVRAFQRPGIVSVRPRIQRFPANDTTPWYADRVFGDFTITRSNPTFGTY